MTNDSAHFSIQGETKVKTKSPSANTLSFLRQFARVYSIHPGSEFSCCILN